MSRTRNRALVAAVLLLSLGVAGLAAYTFFGPGRAEANSHELDQAEVPEPVAPELSFLTLEPFVTDLADRDRRRYLEVTVVLALKDEQSLEVARKMEPRIRDLILGQLRGSYAAELGGAQGKDQMVTQMRERLGEALKDRLEAVYITNLLVH